MLGIMPSNLFLSLAQVIREYSTNKNRVPNTISVATIISHNMESINGRGLREKDMVGIKVWDQVLGRFNLPSYRDMIQLAVRSPSQVFNKGPSSRKVVNTLEKMA